MGSNSKCHFILLRYSPENEIKTAQHDFIFCFCVIHIEIYFGIQQTDLIGRKGRQKDRKGKLMKRLFIYTL